MGPRTTFRAPARRRRGFARHEGPVSGRYLTGVAAMALAAFTAIVLWDGSPPGLALPLFGPRAPAEPDREQAYFTRCSGPVRTTCVVDGDTFWYQGTKIRIADINTPEVSAPGCAAEARLGEAATRRLIALLNQGAFTLQTADRETDRYGRALRVVTRQGHSLGATLEAEGLAEHWRGFRRDWC
ncbi:thermonuclease family protein [Novosphingobium sp. H3SJ31-1]|uniref:Thermonuclease family protein n=2 Tax=Novosphingobium album (ex Liu et al. 2023) TaxID=3031130 RepID=A0ABT5WXE8_9SPHN|nr:thermonuclease family protein [Novosphingobium album (ex Liu et al. 2023)]